ncbi:hypothetical protein [Streptomyces sp. Z26]|uniref:hypothetical protein n=1 Tax=Streptomyces sp. Z26 TaxID=2500177 RepID=UPI000EF14DBB|nr:hypothetical protein [Streptomyces sp. Z26]RLL67008.1 hypothetical protein D7M15_09170 [Streptomyces sp. Z26]
MPTHTPTQGTHHVVITLSKPVRGGLISSTSSFTYTPLPGQTRLDAYMDIRRHVERENPAVSGGNVVFFAIEPNQF